jgi:hypothetical protein
MAVLDPEPKSTTDGYQVVQSDDGTIGIPRGVNFPKIPNSNNGQVEVAPPCGLLSPLLEWASLDRCC